MHLCLLASLYLLRVLLHLLHECIIVPLSQVQHGSQLVDATLVLGIDTLQVLVGILQFFLLQQSALDLYLQLVVHLLLFLYQEVNMHLVAHGVVQTTINRLLSVIKLVGKVVVDIVVVIVVY